jgi:hypothetical protein
MKSAIPLRTREVLAYFLRNPKAVDSLEGVTRWRVPEEAVHFTLEQVDHALNWLVDKRFLLRETPSGVTPLFRLNHDRISDAEHLLTDLLKYTWVDTADALAHQGGMMTLVLTWLDATLVHYLRENPPRVNDQPGLTRSHASLEALLTRRHIEETSDVAAVRRKRDVAARALSDTCTHA